MSSLSPKPDPNFSVRDLSNRLGKVLYVDSVTHQDGATLWLERDDKQLGLIARSGHEWLELFEGRAEPFDADAVLKRCPPTHANAGALRRALAYLQPRPLGLSTSAGFGDRLGLATPGHVLALQRVGGSVAPIFAQQSIREMTRTWRSPQEVMTDATWGAFQAGWTGQVGADADHLKTPDDIDACAEAGFSFFTIDPGDHVDGTAHTASPDEVRDKVAALPWARLETTQADLLRHYEDRKLELETFILTFEKEDVLRAAAKYGAAIAHVVTMYRHLENKNILFELEVSVDETDTPTTHCEHTFIASELKRLGVKWVSLAPRYVGSFEKGIDYIGDLDELRKDLAGHAEVARALGPYKLSLHSGSDKFSVYPLITKAAQGLVHLKTAGTSYLEALRVIATENPELFKRILDLAHERFQEDRKSYHLSCELSRVPTSFQMRDKELPGLLEQNDARQVLHVTFGSALDAFGTEIRRVLNEHKDKYYETLAAHFEQHLRPFVEGSH